MRRALVRGSTCAILIGLALLSGCSSGSENASGGADGSKSAAELATYQGADRQEVLEKAACEEGSLLLYTQTRVERFTGPMSKAFMKKYPCIDLKFVRASGGDIMNRLRQESAAGGIKADVYQGSLAGGPAVQAGFTLPFWSPGLKDINPKYRDQTFTGDPDTNQQAPTTVKYLVLAYNTDMLSASEVPHSYQDLLDPKWKGKIAWTSDAGNGAPVLINCLIKAWGEDKAMAWLQEFSKQEPVNTGGSVTDTLLGVERGEYPLALQTNVKNLMLDKHDGAPVAAVSLDPTPTLNTGAVLLKDTKHPAAAMLLIDFYLTKQAADLFNKGGYLPTLKGANPNPIIAPAIPSESKQQYMSGTYLADNLKRGTDTFNNLFG